MGQLTIDKVYSRLTTLIGDTTQNVNSMKGAVHTLKSMILKSNEASEEVARRLTSTFDSSSNQSFGEKLLEFLAKYAPNEVAVIGLNSTVFRDTMGTKMCDVILQVNKIEQL